jgi:hypothetical protein
VDARAIAAIYYIPTTHASNCPTSVARSVIIMRRLRSLHIMILWKQRHILPKDGSHYPTLRVCIRVHPLFVVASSGESHNSDFKSDMTLSNQIKYRSFMINLPFHSALLNLCSIKTNKQPKRQWITSTSHMKDYSPAVYLFPLEHNVLILYKLAWFETETDTISSEWEYLYNIKDTLFRTLCIHY